MVSKFRKNLNQSFCLVMHNGKWCVANRMSDRIFLSEGGEIMDVCTSEDTEKYKLFLESMEYEAAATCCEYECGDTLVIDGTMFYVVDAGFRGEDGNVKYRVAR